MAERCTIGSEMNELTFNAVHWIAQGHEIKLVMLKIKRIKE
jgi:hypothetical protein